MSLRYVQGDAFTTELFRGNPAAVVVTDEALPEARMQAVAAELNLSETAFLTRKDAEVFALRWFTPTSEIELCGHATLASAHVLWEDGVLPRGDAARFDTLSGRLTCVPGDEPGLIAMDFPATAPIPHDGEAPAFVRALGIDAPRFVGLAGAIWLVEVEGAAALRALTPDMNGLKAAGRYGFIVTCRSDEASYDVLSRSFFPALGIDEDPVTGASHCVLAPYWSAKLGKTSLVGYQASRRGGVVRMRLDGDRCVLAGHAVTVLEGAFRNGAGI